MTYSEAEDLLYEDFKDRWYTVYPGWDHNTRSNLPNDKFTPPSGKSWMIYRVFLDTSSEAALGKTLYRRDGSVDIQMNMPLNRGRSEPQKLKSAILDFFEEAQIDGIRFDEISVTEVGPLEDEGWYRILATIPFQTDEVR